MWENYAVGKLLKTRLRPVNDWFQQNPCYQPGTMHKHVITEDIQKSNYKDTGCLGCFS